MEYKEPVHEGIPNKSEAGNIWVVPIMTPLFIVVIAITVVCSQYYIYDYKASISYIYHGKRITENIDPILLIIIGIFCVIDGAIILLGLLVLVGFVIVVVVGCIKVSCDYVGDRYNDIKNKKETFVDIGGTRIRLEPVQINVEK